MTNMTIRLFKFSQSNFYKYLYMNKFNYLKGEN